MDKRVIILIVFVLAISSCASPEKLENRYNEIGSGCIDLGKSMDAVESCLNLEFRKSRYKGQLVKDHQSCKPYWGYPFVESCGGLKVIYNQNNTVVKWFAWGQLDGV